VDRAAKAVAATADRGVSAKAAASVRVAAMKVPRLRLLRRSSPGMMRIKFSGAEANVGIARAIPG
jgi:hypothetical protein